MEQQIDLSRFIEAHKRSYATALQEIRNGRKTSHWMWYIFPQMSGLGKSPTSQYYAIKSREEAVAFIRDPYLGGNLIEISNALLGAASNNATEIMGKPDDWKLRSSMTLFAQVSGEPVFQQVLDKFFEGRPDNRTVFILKEMSGPSAGK